MTFNSKTQEALDPQWILFRLKDKYVGALRAYRQGQFYGAFIDNHHLATEDHIVILVKAVHPDHDPLSEPLQAFINGAAVYRERVENCPTPVVKERIERAKTNMQALTEAQLKILVIPKRQHDVTIPDTV